jgi:peptidoglycan/LPS O-acetylase OafA/YrhL
MIRSILSIVIGYAAMVFATVVATVLLCKAFGIPLNPSGSMPKPTTGFSAANLAASALCALLGGYVAASIAKRAPRLHAFVLGGIVLVLGLGYAAFARNGPEPAWYLALLPLVGAFAAAAGGMLKSAPR